jgi:hypothetical protein
MTTLSTAEKEALAAFYEDGCKNDSRTRRWIWIRFSSVVLLLSARSLMAVFFPEQFAYLFPNAEVYFDTVLYRLWLFLPLAAVYALAFGLRVYLREASLAAAVILSTLLWADIELHLVQHTSLTEFWSGQIVLRLICVALALQNFVAASKLDKSR